MGSMGTGRAGSLAHTFKRFHPTVALLCWCVLSAHSYECPDGCVCEDTSVICVGSGEMQQPFEVSSGTQNFSFQGYTLGILPEGAFSPNGTALIALSLRNNSMQVIESRAFWGLDQLGTLDLCHNSLTMLSPYAFFGLTQLRNLYLNQALMPSGAAQLPSALSSARLARLHRLELAGNALKAMPIRGFGDLSLTTLVLTNNTLQTLDKSNISNFKALRNFSVYLAMNPLDCDCKHKEFFIWLKNSSQCADASEVFCALPDKTNKRILVKNMDCKSSDLDAMSYVFLGIVLALIGVVFLMVLYLNRRGIKRWLNNIREACRDQMEVYHYRYEQDSDPRLANVAV